MFRSPLLPHLAAVLVTRAAGCGGSGDKAGGPRAPADPRGPGRGERPDRRLRPRGRAPLPRDARRSWSRARLFERATPSTSPAGGGAAHRRRRPDLAPSRAWESQGVTTFRALQAPFLVTDEALLRRIVSGPIGAEILRGTDRIGVIGLALLPDALAGRSAAARSRSLAICAGPGSESSTQPRPPPALRALGAIPVTGLHCGRGRPGARARPARRHRELRRLDSGQRLPGGRALPARERGAVP